MSGNYRHRCIVSMTADTINAMYGKEAYTVFRRKAKQFLGTMSLEGMSDADQISRMNKFWKHTLEPIPGTTFIRAWLENGNNMDEYILLFKNYWLKEVIQVGALK